MTLTDYRELAAYWRDHPPTHLLLGAFFGYRGAQNRNTDLAELLDVIGPKGRRDEF